MILKCDKYLSNTSVRDNRDISILALSFWVGWQADISTQLIVLLWQSTTSAWLSTLHFVEHWMNSPCWVSWESCYLCFFFVLFCLFLLFLQPNCNNYNVNPLEQFWPSQLHPVKKKTCFGHSHCYSTCLTPLQRRFPTKKDLFVKEDHPFVTRTRALLKGDMLLWNLAGGKLRQEDAGGKINQIRGDKFGVFRGESASNNLFPRLRLNIQLISKIQLRQQP